MCLGTHRRYSSERSGSVRSDEQSTLDPETERLATDLQVSADSENRSHPASSLTVSPANEDPEDDDDTYWQSDGREPHKITVRFPPDCFDRLDCRLYAPSRGGLFGDTSYFPQSIRVFAGTSLDRMIRYKSITVQEAADRALRWKTVLHYDDIMLGSNTSTSGGSIATSESTDRTSPTAEALRALLTNENSSTTEIAGGSITTPSSPPSVAVGTTTSTNAPTEMFIRLEFRSSGINCRVHGLRVIKRKRPVATATKHTALLANSSLVPKNLLYGLDGLELALSARSPVAVSFDPANRLCWTISQDGVLARYFIDDDDDDPEELAQEDISVDNSETSLLQRLASVALASTSLEADVTVERQRCSLAITAAEVSRGRVATVWLGTRFVALDALACTASHAEALVILDIDPCSRSVLRIRKDLNEDEEQHKSISILLAGTKAAAPGGALATEAGALWLSRRGLQRPSGTLVAVVHGTQVLASAPDAVCLGLGPAPLVPGWRPVEPAAVVALLDYCQNSQGTALDSALALLACVNASLLGCAEHSLNAYWPEDRINRALDVISQAKPNASYPNLKENPIRRFAASLERLLPIDSEARLALVERSLSSAPHAPLSGLQIVAFWRFQFQKRPEKANALLEIVEARLRLASNNDISNKKNRHSLLLALKAATLAAVVSGAAVRALLGIKVLLSSQTVPEAVSVAKRALVAVGALCTVRCQSLGSLDELINVFSNDPSEEALSLGLCDIHLALVLAREQSRSRPVLRRDLPGLRGWNVAARRIDKCRALFNEDCSDNEISHIEHELYELLLLGDDARDIRLDLLLDAIVTTIIDDTRLSMLGNSNGTTLSPDENSNGSIVLEDSLNNDDDDLLSLGSLLPTPSNASVNDNASEEAIFSEQEQRIQLKASNTAATRAAFAALLHHLDLGKHAVTLMSGSGRCPRPVARAWQAAARIHEGSAERALLLLTLPRHRGTATRPVTARPVVSRLVAPPQRRPSDPFKFARQRSSLALVTDAATPVNNTRTLTPRRPGSSFFGAVSSLKLWRRQLEDPDEMMQSSGREYTVSTGSGTSPSSNTHSWTGVKSPFSQNEEETSLSQQRLLLQRASSQQISRRSWSSFMWHSEDEGDIRFIGEAKIDVVALVSSFVGGIKPAPGIAALKRARDVRTLIAMDRADALDLVAKLLDQPSHLRVKIHACHLAKRELAGKHKRLRHFTADVVGAKPAASAALRSAALKVCSKLLKLVVESSEASIRCAALDAMCLDYLVSPATDDYMLSLLQMPKIVAKVLMDKDARVVACGRRLVDKLLASSRPSTPLTRSLVGKASEDLAMQSKAAIAISDAAIKYKFVHIGPNEDGGFLVRLPEYAEQSNASQRCISLWFQRKDKTIPKKVLIFAVLRPPSKTTSGKVEAEAALEMIQDNVSDSNNVSLVWTNTHGAAIFSQGWQAGLPMNQWVRLVLYAPDPSSALLGAPKLYIDGIAARPCFQPTPRSHPLCVPAIIPRSKPAPVLSLPSFSMLGVAHQEDEKNDPSPPTKWTTWAIGQLCGAAVTSANGIVAGFEVKRVTQSPVSPKSPSNIDQVVPSKFDQVPAEIDLAALGRALRVLRQRARSGDISRDMIDYAYKLADAPLAPITARTAALRSLSFALPQLIMTDLTLLPETDFLLRRIDDAGRAIITQEDILNDHFLSRGSDAVAAAASACTHLLRAVAVSSSGGAKSVGDALRIALTPATLNGSDWIQNDLISLRVAGALLCLSSALQRPALGDTVIITNNQDEDDDHESTNISETVQKKINGEGELGVLIGLSAFEENDLFGSIATVELHKRSKFERVRVLATNLRRAKASTKWLELLVRAYEDQNYGEAECLVALLAQAVAAIVNECSTHDDTAPALLPLEAEIQSAIFESEHPYLNSTVLEKEFIFPGATRLEIEFDEACATEPDADYLRFFKDSSKRTGHYGAAKYTGARGSTCWRHKLTINTDRVFCVFTSDRDVVDWGLRFTVTATLHRALAPAVDNAGLRRATLGAAAVAALDAILSKHTTLVTAAYATAGKHLLASLAKTYDKCATRLGEEKDKIEALFKTPQTPHTNMSPGAPSPLRLSEATVYDIDNQLNDNTEAAHPPPIRRFKRGTPSIYESEHDYDNDTDQTECVSISGAAKLEIIFDERTVTENTHDWLALYLDANCERLVPGSRPRYSGDPDNWPGIFGNAPVVVLGSKFYYRWHTDSSNTFWGWRMVVTPLFPIADAKDVDDRPDLAAGRASSLLAFLATGGGTCSKSIFGENNKARAILPSVVGFTTDNNTPISNRAYSSDSDEPYYVDPREAYSAHVAGIEKETADEDSDEPPILPLIAGARALAATAEPRRWRVVCEGGDVRVHALPSLESDNLDVLTLGRIITERDRQDGWIKHDGGWSLITYEGIRLLELLPLVPIAIVDEDDSRENNLSNNAVRCLAVIRPLPQIISTAFEAIVLNSGGLAGVGFIERAKLRALTASEQSPIIVTDEKISNALFKQSHHSNNAPCVNDESKETPPGIEGDENDQYNDEGARVRRSTRILRFGIWYCGRHLDAESMPNSDGGQCGPNSGPQCLACVRFQRKCTRRAAQREISISRPASKLRISLESGNGDIAYDTDDNGEYVLSLTQKKAVWIAEPTANRVTCPNGHQLTPLEWRSGVRCDGTDEANWICPCAAVSKTPCIRWNCSDCDYDYCDECYDAKLRLDAYRLVWAGPPCEDSRMNRNTQRLLAVPTSEAVIFDDAGDDEEDEDDDDDEQPSILAVAMRQFPPLAIDNNVEKDDDENDTAAWTFVKGDGPSTFWLISYDHADAQYVLCYDSKHQVFCLKSPSKFTDQDEQALRIDIISDDEDDDAFEEQGTIDPKKVSKPKKKAIDARGEALELALGFKGLSLRGEREGSILGFEMNDMAICVYRDGTLVARHVRSSNTSMVPAVLGSKSEFRSGLIALNLGQKAFKHNPDLSRIIKQEPPRLSYIEVNISLNENKNSWHITSGERRILTPPLVPTDSPEVNQWDPVHCGEFAKICGPQNWRVVNTCSGSGDNVLVRTKFGYSTGRHVWTISCLQRTTSGNGYHCIGICRADAPARFRDYDCGPGFWGIHTYDSAKVSVNGREEYGSFVHDAGTLYEVILDLNECTLSFKCNGRDQGVAFSGLPGNTIYYPALAVGCLQENIYEADFSIDSQSGLPQDSLTKRALALHLAIVPSNASGGAPPLLENFVSLQPLASTEIGSVKLNPDVDVLDEALDAATDPAKNPLYSFIQSVHSDIVAGLEETTDDDLGNSERSEPRGDDEDNESASPEYMITHITNDADNATQHDEDEDDDNVTEVNSPQTTAPISTQEMKKITKQPPSKNKNTRGGELLVTVNSAMTTKRLHNKVLSTASSLAVRSLTALTRAMLQSVLKKLVVAWPTTGERNAALTPSAWGGTEALLDVLALSVVDAASEDHDDDREHRTDILRLKTATAAATDTDVAVALAKEVTRAFRCEDKNTGASRAVVALPRVLRVVNVGHRGIPPSTAAAYPVWPMTDDHPPEEDEDIAKSRSVARPLDIGESLIVRDRVPVKTGEGRMIFCYLGSDDNSTAMDEIFVSSPGGTSSSTTSSKSKPPRRRAWYHDHCLEVPEKRTLVAADTASVLSITEDAGAVVECAPGFGELARYLRRPGPRLSTFGVHSKRRQRKQRGDAYASFCLEALAMAAENENTAASTALASERHGAAIFASLADLVLSWSPKGKHTRRLLDALRGLTLILRAAAQPSLQISPLVITQLRRLRQVLVDRAGALVRIEASSDRKSVLLQLLVEAALAAHRAFDMIPSIVSECQSYEQPTFEWRDGPTVSGSLVRGVVTSDDDKDSLKKSDRKETSEEEKNPEETMKVKTSRRELAALLAASTPRRSVFKVHEGHPVLRDEAVAASSKLAVSSSSSFVTSHGSFCEAYYCELERAEISAKEDGTIKIEYRAAGDGSFGDMTMIDPQESMLIIGSESIGRATRHTTTQFESHSLSGILWWQGIGAVKLVGRPVITLTFANLFPECIVPAATRVTPFALVGLRAHDALVAVDDDEIVLTSDDNADAAVLRHVDASPELREVELIFQRMSNTELSSDETVDLTIAGICTTVVARYIQVKAPYWWTFKINAIPSSLILVGGVLMREDDTLPPLEALGFSICGPMSVALGSDGTLRARGETVVDFGPKFCANDTISFGIWRDGSVEIWYNGAKLGIGVGMNAEIYGGISIPLDDDEDECFFTQEDRCWIPAISVTSPDDEIELSTWHPSIMSKAKENYTLLPAWLEAASAAEAVLKRIEAGYEKKLSAHSQASDAALVAWLDSVSTSRGASTYDCFEWSKIKPEPDQLMAQSAELRSVAELAANGELDLDVRLLEISRLNSVLTSALPLVPYGEARMTAHTSTLAGLFVKHRHLLYAGKKKALLEECLRATDVHGGKPVDIELSRIGGSELEERASRDECDADATWSVFGQAYRAVCALMVTGSSSTTTSGNKSPQRTINSSVFRMRSERLFRVKLKGEHAIDQGGPFREILSTLVAELESRLLPLLIPTPNNTSDAGQHRECFLLNPRACDVLRNPRHDLHRRMLVFLGQLMGYCLRNSEFMSLSLAPPVWKRLVGEQLTFDDLRSVDEAVASSLVTLKEIETAAEFEAIFVDLRFEFLSSDGITTIELEPNGSHRIVHFEDRFEFFDKAVKMRLEEFDIAAEALRAGLASTVPQLLLALYAGHQLETLVCGSIQIDVALLKRNTIYESCSEHEPHIKAFWKVLEHMDHRERSVFLRFVWGRSRLPMDPVFPTKFKINRFNVPVATSAPRQQLTTGLPSTSASLSPIPETPALSDSPAFNTPRIPTADDFFPIGHTCFFAIDLPAYSSFEIARKKIRYAIHNCRAIDGDTG
uniref:Uncharacterized protein n=1 Tax=Aureoumbra lagunensis TaxID=44058 RepID=A0A7S3JQH8_9STRA